MRFLPVMWLSLPGEKRRPSAGPGLAALLLFFLASLFPLCAEAAQPRAGQQTPTEREPPAGPPTKEKSGHAVNDEPDRKPKIFLLGRKAVLLAPPLPPQLAVIQQSWADLLARHDPKAVFAADTNFLPPPILTQWKNITAQMPSISPDQKLRIINGFFNNWSSISDKQNYKQDEYWASPAEFLHNGGGDCEDYAIIKFFALRYFSWPEEDLWIVFGDDLINKGKHTVLAARMNEKIFILDNLSRPAYLLIPEAQYAKQVDPLFALNGRGVWVFTATTHAPPPAREKEKAHQP